jgi:hypothetical protein
MLIMTAQHGRTLQIAKERADDWKNKQLAVGAAQVFHCCGRSCKKLDTAIIYRLRVYSILLSIRATPVAISIVMRGTVVRCEPRRQREADETAAEIKAYSAHKLAELKGAKSRGRVCH